MMPLSWAMWAIIAMGGIALLIGLTGNMEALATGAVLSAVGWLSYWLSRHQRY